jgi:hypothetical protein
LLQFAQKKTYQVNGKAHLHPYLHHNHNVLWINMAKNHNCPTTF